MIVTASVIVLISSFFVGQGECDPSRVTIPELGTIQGGANWTFPLFTPTRREFYFFAGIPYASPESYTGPNRFKVSQWNMTYSTMHFSFATMKPFLLVIAFKSMGGCTRERPWKGFPSYRLFHRMSSVRCKFCGRRGIRVRMGTSGQIEQWENRFFKHNGNQADWRWVGGWCICF